MRFLIIASIYSALTATAWAVELIMPLPGTGPSVADPAVYIRNIFIYAIGLAGLLVMAEIVFGAVQYTASAGNPSRQGDAKDRILNAIYGLLLLLTSFVILYTINPNLVILRAPEIEPLRQPTEPLRRPLWQTIEEFHRSRGRAFQALGLPEVAPNTPISSEVSEQYQNTIDRIISGETSVSAEDLSLIIAAQETEQAWNERTAIDQIYSINNLQELEQHGLHETNASRNLRDNADFTINEINQDRLPRIQSNLENLRALQTQSQP